jgi:sigma-B regulation protein RsbU (phosphoserine phosphatase)
MGTPRGTRFVDPRAVPLPRVLVADDQPDILQALRLLLSDAGFAPDLVGSVHDVIDRVSSDSYDLLLMDLNYTRDTTSGREGLDLLDEVRSRDSGLPIVVMTGWGSIETAVDAMRRGAKSFVQKPWDDTMLVEVVRREVTNGLALRRRDARLAHEHSEARLIQRALLPSAMPPIKGCELAVRWTPAFGIGGDFFDVLRFSDTRVGLAIADVIGKGLPAALLMSNLQAAVRAFASSAAEPQDVCSSVNRLLCRNIAAGKFVTFCYAVVDTEQRTVSFANAGHNPPMLVHRRGWVDRLNSAGLVLGVAADWQYNGGSYRLEPGDRLVCFTDGITEAEDASREQFGESRLLDIIRRNQDASAEVLVQAVSDAVRRWTGESPQDDATLLAVALH